MATYYNHCQVGIVDASGNVNVIYPQTYASDVKVGTANKGIGIDTSSTVQSLITALGTAAIKNVGDLVTNSASSASTTQAYSCAQINSKLTELNSKMYSSPTDILSDKGAGTYTVTDLSKYKILICVLTYYVQLFDSLAVSTSKAIQWNYQLTLFHGGSIAKQITVKSKTSLTVADTMTNLQWYCYAI